jgi:dTMP kinase
MIDAYLRSQSELDDRAIHLLFSANRWELVFVSRRRWTLARVADKLFRPTIERELAAGTTILCDRYAFSGVAFSAAKPSLSFEWCKLTDIGLPEPDLVVFLDVSTGVARSRGGYGEERYEKEETQRRVRDIFKRIEEEAKQSKDVHGMNWVTINADGTLADVEQTIWEVVEPLSKGTSGPVGKLWNNNIV